MFEKYFQRAFPVMPYSYRSGKNRGRHWMCHCSKAVIQYVLRVGVLWILISFNEEDLTNICMMKANFKTSSETRKNGLNLHNAL